MRCNTRVNDGKTSAFFVRKQNTCLADASVSLLCVSCIVVLMQQRQLWLICGVSSSIMTSMVLIYIYIYLDYTHFKSNPEALIPNLNAFSLLLKDSLETCLIWISHEMSFLRHLVFYVYLFGQIYRRKSWVSPSYASSFPSLIHGVFTWRDKNLRFFFSLLLWHHERSNQLFCSRLLLSLLFESFSPPESRATQDHLPHFFAVPSTDQSVAEDSSWEDSVIRKDILSMNWLSDWFLYKNRLIYCCFSTCFSELDSTEEWILPHTELLTAITTM